MHKILIVDDTEINLKILSAIVKKIPNTEIFLFDNPLDAVQWCEKNEPDIIIVDYLMPQLNGIEFTKIVREEFNYKHTPIVMITAIEEKEVKHRALDAGVIDFMRKPFDVKEVKAKVRNFLMIREYELYLIDKAKWLKLQVEKAIKEIKEREIELIHRLVLLAEYRDEGTGEHIKRVSHYSRIIAEAMGMKPEEVEIIYLAAPMHDIGKVGVPDSILLKPGKLTEEEFEIIKQHTIIGYNILKDSKSKLIKTGAIIALRHHEKWNGEGYPDGLKGEEIPVEGRIVAVADVFDALTSDRPYRKAWDFEEAFEYIKQEKGKHFSPQCVDLFIRNKEKIKEIYNEFH